MKYGAAILMVALVLGGGSVELAALSTSGAFQCDSLPIGAIRVYHCGMRDGVTAELERLRSLGYVQ